MREESYKPHAKPYRTHGANRSVLRYVATMTSPIGAVLLWNNVMPYSRHI
jgi:hypothetical protein